MEITAITATDIDNASWGEWVEFPLATPMIKWDEFNNADGQHPEAFRNWLGPVGDVFVEVETDAGITGYGQANWGTGAITTIIDETLSKLVIGRDPRRREELWEMMYKATLAFGRKGAAIEAISAIDIALWDIAGKAAGKPVYELLGGPVRADIPAYASNLHPVSEETLRREAQEYVEAGFDTMKLRFKHGPEAGKAGMAENEAIVRTVRETVGDEIAIAGDAYMSWSVRYAKRMVERLEPYDMAWVEEPVIPDDVAGYADVREAAPMPISGGEHEFTRWGHKRLLEEDAVDILQPDVHRVGGFTELKKVADMAEAQGVPVVPHAGTKPTLHFIAAHPNAPMVEYFPVPAWFQEREQAERDSTYADALYENPPEASNGSVPLPESDGVGIEINRDALEYYAVE